ncbi:DHH family phosphoesterase [Candidatus Woesearchaeota archaeon]|nr:DHH family phosphoesterase [Candidatus Woesearchaeota archaeon]
MGLSKEQIEKIREELSSCTRPLIFFDDDPDGLASFLLFYRYVGDGRGVVVKAKPELNDMFVRKVDEYAPDKVFVLDKPQVSEDFIQAVQQKIVWIDHHEPVQLHGVTYFNPMLGKTKDNRPVSYWCYRVVTQDLWIAMVGIVGDWFLPKLSKRFSKQYPELLPASVKSPEQALFSTKLGELTRIFSFVLKGKTSTVNSCVKVLTRIESPYEILEQSTPKGKFIYKKFLKVNSEYQFLLSQALQVGKSKDNLLVYIYNDDKMSFTGDLSNELLYRFPNKVIIVGRERNGEVKSSLRSAKRKILPSLKKALVGVEGYGGGHMQACGACVKSGDWEVFLNNLRQNLN